jgi:CBS-domain-containing membrane protein
MKWGVFYKREVKLWHKYFIPMFVAGAIVALLSFFFELNGANVAMFTSVGASAVLLTYKKRHHLTTLKTTIWSYLAASIAAIIIDVLCDLFGASLQVKVFLAVTIVAILIISLNIFHPPAISAALSFVMFKGDLWELFFLVLAVLVAFVFLRLLIYVVTEKLTFNEFWHELKL